MGLRHMPESVGELLRQRASEGPHVVAYTYRSQPGLVSESVTYQQLDRRARAYAAHLRSLAEPGDHALLLYPPGLDYVVAFFGCVYAGVVAVPGYPPTSFEPEAAERRLARLAGDACARLALTTDAVAERHRSTSAAGDVPWCAVSHDLPAAPELEPFPAAGDALAMLQYTSGSTDSPKGVMVTQANLLSNIRVIADGLGTREGTTFVSWLPLYHDMGLVAGVLHPVLVGGTQHLMSPVTFLRRPFAWLEAISSERAAVSVVPNFAFEHCLRRISAAEVDRLDLSSWEVAATGAEPVRPETLRRFSQAFARAGFRREAMYPCYGLAEATCAVSGGDVSVPPVVVLVDRDALQRGEARVADDDGDGLEVVGCGHTYLDHSIAIVSDDGVACGDGQVGEIWITGSSVARGYWGRPEASARVFGARLPDDDRAWMRTGDLGFQRDGELFVVGRLRDVIIVRGRNHAPEDIEMTVGGCELVEPGGVVAFGVEREGEERLVLIVALERGASAQPGLEQAITHQVALVHGLQVHDIVFVRGGAIPRTSSGKVQRRACRDAYCRGEIKAKGDGVRGAAVTI